MKRKIGQDICRFDPHSIVIEWYPINWKKKRKKSTKKTSWKILDTKKSCKIKKGEGTEAFYED